MSFNQTLNEKVVPVVMKFVNLKGVQALKDGVLYTLPLNIIGSMFLLIACFPVPAVVDFFAAIFGPSWNDPLFKLKDATMGIMALVSVTGMAYIYAKNEGIEPFAPSALSLSVFVLLTNNFVMFAPAKDAAPVAVGGVIPTNVLDGKGMVAAIIIALLVASSYCTLMKKNITIKMPEGVPQGVANAFSALIPATIILIAADAIYAICKFAFNSSLLDIIYKVLQVPLQGASDSLPGVMLIAFSVPFLWFFGIHGGATIGGVVTGLLNANTADNALLQKAGTLDLAHGAHIVTMQFYDNFINMAGSGHTLGFAILMVLFAKSSQYKQLGRLALPANLCNINEPILFGTPIVMNPIMGVPFIITPLINATLLYLAIKFQILAPMGATMPPWTTPPILGGFLIGGFGYAAAQALFLVIGLVIYFPFFKKVDAMAYADEVAAQHHGEAAQV